MAQRLVMAIDDEPLITRLIQVNLQRLGYRVNSALDGLEALEILRSGQPLPDLILLDVMMPYMDGFQMLAALKQDAALHAIPVVMLTARSRDADLIKGEELGATQYLTKPINPKDLIDMVRLLIGNAESEP